MDDSVPVVGHTSYVLYAVAGVLKEEYDAFHGAGFLLQVDCPDLNTSRRKGVELGVEVLGHALRDTPSDRTRTQVCWGNSEGTHHLDVPL